MATRAARYASIALLNVAISALRAHRVRQLETRLAAGPAWQEPGFASTTPTGTPLDPSDVNRAFKQLLKMAGLPPYGFTTCGTRVPRCCWLQGLESLDVVEIR